MSTLYYESSFAHHGVKGQKWGVRRYQNPDGTLTKAGLKRYSKQDPLGFVKDTQTIANKLYRSDETRSSKAYKDLLDLVDEWKEVHSPILEFKKNRKVYEEYSKKASRMLADKDYEMHEGRKPTEKEYAEWLEYYNHEGGNNGQGWYMYAKDNGIDFRKIDTKILQVAYKIEKQSEILTTEMCKQYGGLKIDKLPSDLERTIKNNFDTIIRENLLRKVVDEGYCEDDGDWLKR